MKTARQLTTAAMIFTALAFATSLRAQTDPAPAAEPVLKAIPDDALGFVLIKGIGQTDKAISKLAAAVQAPVPDVLSQLKMQAGIKDGLDDNGSAAVALLPNKSAGAAHPSPVPFVFLPVTDYKKFISQFKPEDEAAAITGVTVAGHALVVGDKGAFAVFTLPDHKEQLATVIASTKGVDSMLASMEPWIGRHQVSLIAMPAGSKMLFHEGAAAIKQFKAVFARLQNPRQTAQVVAAFDMYENILTKAEQEVDSFGVGVALDESSNLSIDSHTTFVAGGTWAAAMKDVKPAEESRFAGVPAMPFIFAGQGVIPAAWADGLAELSAKYMGQMSKAGGAEGMTEQRLKDYADAMRSMMKGMHSISFVMAPSKPGRSIYDGIVELIKVDNTRDFLGQYQKSMNQIVELSKGQKDFPMKFSDVKKIEIDGHAGLAVSMDLSGLFTAQNNPATAKLMPLLLGADKLLSMKIVAADDRTLVASFGNDERAKAALAAAVNSQSNFASDPDVAATLKLLPPGAPWIGLVSIKGYMDFIGGIMSAVAPPGAQLKLPALPAMPAMPPIGFAAGAGNGSLDTQMVLPVETIVGIGKVVHHSMAPPSRPAAH